MIGDKLRRERERQGLTIKDVEHGTSIRALYIEAIERGDWDTLPGDVYTKGFIRNVATFLQLDANACVAEYTADTAEKFGDESETPNGKDATGINVPGNDNETTVNELRQKLESKERKQKRLIILMSLIVVCGIAYLFMTADNGRNTTKVIPKENIVAVTEQTPPAKTATTATPVNEKQPPAPNQKATDPKTAQPAANNKTTPASKPAAPTTNKQGVELTATFNDRCWMKVIADGAVIYEGTVEKGNTLSWKGTERIAITAGNAGALSITHNGKNLGQAGAYGEVVNKTFTKEGVN